jgi:hypothetical protein
MLGKVGKELGCKLARSRVDQPSAELRDLAADIRLNRIEQHGGIRTIFGELYIRAAFGKAGDAALAFAGDGVGVRRVEVRELDRSLEGRLDRAYRPLYRRVAPKLVD